MKRFLALFLALCLALPLLSLAEEDDLLIEEVVEEALPTEAPDLSEIDPEDLIVDEETGETFILSSEEQGKLDSLLEEEPDDTGIDPDSLDLNPNLPDNVMNILLIGVDTRSKDPREILGLGDTQIIVSGELESEEHAVLRILSNRARPEDIRTFLIRTSQFTEQGDRARADAILQVSATANFALYQEIYKEEPNMCQALEEIMKDTLEAKRAEGMQQGIQQNAITNIKTLMETMNWNPLQAMNALRIPEEDRQKYTQLLKQ